MSAVGKCYERAKRAKMLGLAVTTVLLLLTASLCFADELIIPFPVNTREFKKDLLQETGICLYRTPASHGFIEDNASSITIKTYKKFPLEKLDQLYVIAARNVR